MKRANQLQPLSRQHHLGLNLSRHAKECADESEEIAKHLSLPIGTVKSRIFFARKRLKDMLKDFRYYAE